MFIGFNDDSHKNIFCVGNFVIKEIRICFQINRRLILIKSIEHL